MDRRRTMMTIKNIIPHKLTIWLEQEKLKFRAAEKEISKEFLSVLKENKNTLFSFFQLKECQKIDIFPLAQNQKALWFLSQVNNTITSYNVGIACKVHNGLDKDLFKQAVAQLVQKYWPLRAFVQELSSGREVVQCQVVPDQAKPDITFQNISGTEEGIRQRLQQENNKPFNLSEGPLFRTFCYENGDGKQYILFSFHHIICDAISLQLFAADFIQFMGPGTAEEIEQIGNVDISFSDYIHGQYQLMQKQGAEQLAFWESVLSGVEQHLQLPVDFERPAIHNFKGSTQHFVLSKDEGAKLRNLAGNIKTTLNTLLFTVFQIMLAELSRQKSFCIGMPASARTDLDYQRIFGYLINILPVPCKLKTQNSFTELIKSNTDMLYNCLENQDIPFSVVVEKVSGKRDLSSTPIFQVLFNYLNKKALGPLSNFLDFDQDVREWGPLQVSPLKLADQEGQFDLTLEIFDNDTELFCSLKYNTDIFKASTAESFIASFRRILKEIIDSDNYQFSLSNRKLQEGESRFPVNITGSFTVEPIEKPLRFWLNKLNLEPQVDFLGYNQVFQGLLDVSSAFYTQPGSTNILLLRVEDYWKDPSGSNHLNELKEAIQAYAGHNAKQKLMVVFCPVSDRLINHAEFIQESDLFEQEIIDICSATNHIQVIRSSEFKEKYGLSHYYEPIGEDEGHIPYKENFYVAAATLVARKIHSLSTSPFKAIVADCDNTLWSGVVGEDGPLGVTIGAQEKALQEYLIQQHNSGVLVCLCSKNNEKDVWEVFEQNENMLLRKEHIAFYKINWEAKSKNLTALSHEIKIGQDSLVFIDDNPVECEEVRANVPAVLTIQKRPEVDNIEYLTNSWVFDRDKITQEDKKRTSMYKLEAQRTRLKTELKTYKEFIGSLGIQIEINPLTDKELPRVSQLTFRTNQFNFTTIRRTEEQIKELINNTGYEVYYAHLADKFGDYGIIGSFMLNPKAETLEVDSFMLSCRALGKGVEHQMIAFIGTLALEKNKGYVCFKFSKSPKNLVAENFLNAHFKEALNENGDYVLPTETARSFAFNPDEYGQKEQEQKPGKAQPMKMNEDILWRNEFFNDIIENYSSLAAITSMIYPKRKAPEVVGADKQQDSGNKLENQLLTIWKEVLENNNIKVDDNFFDVGGESILMPEIVVRLHNELNITIKVVDIFQYPTIRKLVEYISPKEEPKTPGQKIISNSKLDKLKSQRDRFKKIRKN